MPASSDLATAVREGGYPALMTKCVDWMQEVRDVGNKYKFKMEKKSDPLPRLFLFMASPVPLLSLLSKRGQS